MQTLKNKLKSGRGASLTFALLMFLVCAVVGSAVLTAGTAASGRMSRIAEMDQRYYSVNSAARLLIDALNDQKVRYELKESSKTKSEDALKAEDYDFTVNGKKDGETAASIPDKDKIALAVAKQILDKSASPTFKLEVAEEQSIEALNKADLKVVIAESADAAGNLNFHVKSDGANAYSIKLYFMNTGNGSGFEWKLYDIETTVPLAGTGSDAGG